MFSGYLQQQQTKGTGERASKGGTSQLLSIAHLAFDFTSIPLLSLYVAIPTTKPNKP
jgi:hypothetical protein